MDQYRKLFNTPDAIRILESAIPTLQHNRENPRASQLGAMLRIISKNAEEFDRNCQLNIDWIGNQTLDYIRELASLPNEEGIDMVTALIYRFWVEYDLSVRNDVSMEVRAFVNKVRDDVGSFKDEARSQIEFARQEMPIGIIKKMINTEEFGTLRNMSEIASTVDKKIEGWKHNLDSTEEKATRLAGILEKHTQAFNFVGLHDGFSDLAKEINQELKFAQFGIGIFGLLVLVPSFLDLSLIESRNFDISTLKTQTLIAMTLAIVAMTLLFLYFFRIALRKANSCRAQLIQVRLRMSLCRFIQSYADSSSEMKAKNSDALAKFENLIFSGIVSSDEKLPSTFDGIEQLTALAKSISGK
jgi:hypothetical protein